MTGYLIPSTDAFVEDVARAIARNRLKNEAAAELELTTGIQMGDVDGIELTFDRIFEQLWASPGVTADTQRRNYREDALSAIRAINLKLITSTE
jgi:hypothetical protein